MGWICFCFVCDSSGYVVGKENNGKERRRKGKMQKAIKIEPFFPIQFQYKKIMLKTDYKIYNLPLTNSNK